MTISLHKDIKTPCLNCTNRMSLCHSTCVEYKEYKATISEGRKLYNERFAETQYFRDRAKDAKENYYKKISSHKVVHRHSSEKLEIFE